MLILPVELISLILEHNPLKETISCLFTCKKLYEIVSKIDKWKQFVCYKEFFSNNEFNNKNLDKLYTNNTFSLSCNGLQKVTIDDCFYKVEKIDFNWNILKKFVVSDKVFFGNLKYLNLSNNRFSFFPDSVLGLANLETLIMNKNNISFIPTDIEKLTKLEYADFSDNKIKKLCYIPNVKILLFSGNLVKKIKRNINTMVNLEMLQICRNNIEFISGEIGKVAQMKRLELSLNKLRSIPYELSRLDKLQFLDLSGNFLRFIPIDFDNLHNLELVIIYSNNILSVSDFIYQRCRADFVVSINHYLKAK